MKDQSTVSVSSIHAELALRAYIAQLNEDMQMNLPTRRDVFSENDDWLICHAGSVHSLLLAAYKRREVSRGYKPQIRTYKDAVVVTIRGRLVDTQTAAYLRHDQLHTIVHHDPVSDYSTFTFKLAEPDWPNRIPLLVAKHWLDFVADRKLVPVRPGTARHVDLPRWLAEKLNLVPAAE